MGTLQRTCPLQSKIICQAIQPTYERQRLIDEEIINICITHSRTSFNNQDMSPIAINPEEIAYEVLQTLPPLLDSTHPRNIFELLDLSNDLKLAMSFEKSTGETHRESEPVPQRNAPPKSFTTESKENTQQSKEIKPNLEINSQPGAARRNPFKSAKEQFGEEVCFLCEVSLDS